MQYSTTTGLPIGQRVAVVGCSGAGKSTLARAICDKRGLDYIDSDELFWLPDWVHRPRADYDALLAEAMAGPAWAYDGNLGPARPIILPRVDTLIWLDYPRHVVMSQVLRRTLIRAWTGQRLFAGNVETWRMSFASRDSILRWAWQTHAERRAEYAPLFDDPPADLSMIRLTSPRQAERLLRAL